MLMMGGTVSAKPVDVTTARRVAENYMSANGMKNPEALVDVTSSTPYTEFFIFAASEGGFILVSGDDCVVPVLGYSMTGRFETDGMPENLRSLLDEYERIVLSAKKHGEPSLTKEWESVVSGSVAGGRKSAVAPLLTTTWNQTPYYNALCPFDSAANQRAITGCVATATAQVMKFHNWPATGYGQHTNNVNPAYGPLTVDFSAATYDWCHMPSALTAASSETEVNAVATLMYHVGVGVDMSYSPQLSSSRNCSSNGRLTSSALTALISYFKYRPDVALVMRHKYGLTEYCARLRAELDEGRPILYSGSDDQMGHSFVCDGYDDAGLFHFNWGWNGLADGYYRIGGLVPAAGGAGANSGTYNLDNRALIGIRPNADWAEGSTTVVTATVNSPATVSGSGSYAFGDTVTLQVAVPEGYRFNRWSDGNVLPLRQFIAQGGNYTFNAEVTRLSGDTLAYCDPYATLLSSRALENPDDTWGIRLPASVLTAGRYLKAVQLYVASPGNYTLHVLSGTDAPTDTLYTTTQRFASTDIGGWCSITLTDTLPVDTTQALWLLFTSDAATPMTFALTNCNADGCVINGISETGTGVDFLIRGLFGDGSAARCAVKELAWDESFEEGADCWLRMGAGQWNVASDGGHSGSACLASTGNAWAISPAIVLPADSSVIGLSYYINAPVGLAYEVRLSAGGDNPTNFTNLIYIEGGSTAGWQQRSISLAPYAGQTVHIAFHCLSPMKLDDIRVGQNDSALVYHYISASVNNAHAGSVSGSGLYVEGDTVTLQAVPAEGYQFAYWTPNILTPTLTFIATANYSFTANFITQRPVRSGDTISHCADDAMLTKIANGSPNFHFGTMLPAAALADCDFLRGVMLYSTGTCDYTLNIYRGGEDAPGTLVHTQPLSISSAQEGWQEVVLTDSVPILGENLWVTFCITDAGHTMAVSGYAGENASFISNDGTTWGTLVSRGLLNAFMIKAITGNNSAGIEDVVDDSVVSIRVNHGRIVVEGADGETVQVYDMVGRLTQTFKHSSNQAIPNGVYLVKVGNRPAQKVVVVK